MSRRVHIREQDQLIERPIKTSQTHLTLLLTLRAEDHIDIPHTRLISPATTPTLDTVTITMGTMAEVP